MKASLLSQQQGMVKARLKSYTLLEAASQLSCPCLPLIGDLSASPSPACIQTASSQPVIAHHRKPAVMMLEGMTRCVEL